MSEKTQDEIRKETSEFMEKHRSEPIKVNVSKEQAEKIREILGKKGENENMEKGEFEKQAEFEERMRTFAKTMRQEAKEEREAEEKFLKEDAEIKMGGKGNVGLRAEDLAREKGSSEQKEYDNPLDMLKDLAENDKETYERIKEKASKGLIGNSFEWVDPWENGKSIIKRMLDIQNEKARKEVKGES